jgi:FkbM family methyltransferase
MTTVLVDRYRFARQPNVLAEAAVPALLALFRHPRTRARAALAALQGRPQARQALAAFADDDSRDLFRDLMAYRTGGPAFSRLTRNQARFDALEAWMAAPLDARDPPFVMHDSMGHAIRLWSVEHGGRRLEALGSKYGLYWAFASGQYYFDRGGVRIGPEPGDTVIDAGAFLGETAVRFAVDVGPEGRVYAFDPSRDHASLAAENARRNGLETIEVLAAGLSDRSNVSGLDSLRPPGPNGVPPRADAGRRMADDDAQVALDDVCAWAGIGKVDFIKMDIEGSEIAALEGAHRTIEAHRPKLGVCVYHRPSDLWAIPNLIRTKYPFYALYLDHHSLYGEETVLYAVPQDR